LVYLQITKQKHGVLRIFSENYFYSSRSMGWMEGTGVEMEIFIFLGTPLHVFLFSAQPGLDRVRPLSLAYFTSRFCSIAILRLAWWEAVGSSGCAVFRASA
jgi:hypothetical protein